MAWPLILATAGVGLLRGLQQQNQFKRQLELEAVREENSPFTGRGGNFSFLAKAPNPLASAIQGGISGYLAGGDKGSLDATDLSTQSLGPTVENAAALGPTVQNAQNNINLTTADNFGMSEDPEMLRKMLANFYSGGFNG